VRPPFAPNTFARHISHNYALAVPSVVLSYCFIRVFIPAVVVYPEFQMAEAQAQATPRDTPNPDLQQPPATTSSSSSLLKTAKDKNCPFCGQLFTSSSLGRHLDLYIRPKNPKPADGVHMVDEIRKIRGGITRRQVKGPLKRDSATPVKRLSGTGSNSPSAESPREDEGEDDDSLHQSSAAKRKESFKEVAWGGANVQSLAVKTPEMRRDVSRQVQKMDLDQRHRHSMSDEAETAKATEMALRELLRSVQEAKYARIPPIPTT
jgi:hypothetical protein